MEASVSALHEEAGLQRRLVQEQELLCAELRHAEARLDWSERVSLEPERASCAGAAAAAQPRVLEVFAGGALKSSFWKSS